MAIAVVRDDLDAAGLRAAAAGCRDGAAARRMLALALVIEGESRTEAARVCGMDRQTLRDWVHRYNQEGLAGLSNRHGGGPAALLSAAQKDELKQIVLAGPDLARNGVVRWRCVDLQRVIDERFKVTMAERTVAKLLHALGLSRLTPRPRHPKQDLDAQEDFKKTSQPN
jgi:transposase